MFVKFVYLKQKLHLFWFVPKCSLNTHSHCFQCFQHVTPDYYHISWLFNFFHLHFIFSKIISSSINQNMALRGVFDPKLNNRGRIIKLYTSIGHGMVIIFQKNIYYVSTHIILPYETKVENFKISEILANLVVKHPP